MNMPSSIAEGVYSLSACTSISSVAFDNRKNASTCISSARTILCSDVKLRRAVSA